MSLETVVVCAAHSAGSLFLSFLLSMLCLSSQHIRSRRSCTVNQRKPHPHYNLPLPLALHVGLCSTVKSRVTPRGGSLPSLEIRPVSLSDSETDHEWTRWKTCDPEPFSWWTFQLCCRYICRGKCVFKGLMGECK